MRPAGATPPQSPTGYTTRHSWWRRRNWLFADTVAGANLFFQLISRRYERGPMILTSNQSFGAWGEMFGDRVIATAILDRLLHHAVTMNIRGNSYRA